MSDATTATAPQPETLEILLTGRRPVRIVKDQWPIIARSEDCDDRVHPFQANVEWWIRVRQHLTEGRCLVYGRYSSRWAGDRDRSAGLLVDDIDDVVSAAHRVCELLGVDDALAQDLIEYLPALELC